MTGDLKFKVVYEGRREVTGSRNRSTWTVPTLVRLIDHGTLSTRPLWTPVGTTPANHTADGPVTLPLSDRGHSAGTLGHKVLGPHGHSPQITAAGEGLPCAGRCHKH